MTLVLVADALDTVHSPEHAGAALGNRGGFLFAWTLPAPGRKACPLWVDAVDKGVESGAER